MKKNTPNQFVTLKNNLNPVQQHRPLALNRVLLLLVFSFSLLDISAQNGTTVTPTVMDVKAYISSLKTSNQKTRATVSTSQYVENLVFGIQPAVYYQSSIPKNYGDNPVKLFTDISSLKTIPNSNLLKDNIEIVVIKIKSNIDLNAKIDLLEFSDFPKLKYIYVLSNVNTTDQNISNMFLNYTNQYSIFYKIEIAE